MDLWTPAEDFEFILDFVDKFGVGIEVGRVNEFSFNNDPDLTALPKRQLDVLFISIRIIGPFRWQW